MITGYFLLGAAVAIYVIGAIVFALVFQDLLKKEIPKKAVEINSTYALVATWVISVLLGILWPVLLIIQVFLLLHKWASKTPSTAAEIPAPAPHDHNYTDWTQN